MATNRIFNVSDDKTTLEVFINTNDKIVLRSSENDFDFNPFVFELDEDDAKELVRELNRLIKEL